MDFIADIIYNILYFIDGKDIVLYLTLINKKWYEICKDENFWKQKFKYENYNERLFSTNTFYIPYFKIYDSDITLYAKKIFTNKEKCMETMNEYVIRECIGENTVNVYVRNKRNSELYNNLLIKHDPWSSTKYIENDKNSINNCEGEFLYKFYDNEKNRLIVFELIKFKLTFVSYKTFMVQKYSIPYLILRCNYRSSSSCITTERNISIGGVQSDSSALLTCNKLYKNNKSDYVLKIYNNNKLDCIIIDKNNYDTNQVYDKELYYLSKQNKHYVKNIIKIGMLYLNFKNLSC